MLRIHNDTPVLKACLKYYYTLGIWGTGVLWRDCAEIVKVKDSLYISAVAARLQKTGSELRPIQLSTVAMAYRQGKEAPESPRLRQ